jgi:Protein of unknown function (DUF1353)
MFSTALILEADTARDDFWIVRGPLIWCDPTYGRIEVPVGFLTDLASIPRALRNLPAFDPDGKSRRPAVVHDWLYQIQDRPKLTVDSFLRDAMIAEGCARADADAFYDAVHWFGQSSWDSDHGRTMAASFGDAVAYAVWVNQTSRTESPANPPLPG